LRRTAVLTLLLAGAAGCAQTVGFTECNVDADCAGKMAGGQPLIYCTADHYCVDDLPEARLCPSIYGTASASALRVGALFRLADQSASQTDVIKDDERISALKLVVDDFNNYVATGDQTLQVVLCNSGGNGPDDDTRAYRELVDKYHVGAIVGEPTSGGVHAVSASLPADNVLLVTPAATTADITDLAANGLIFRACPSDDLQGKTLAYLTTKFTGTPIVDVIYVNSTSATLLFDSFKTYFGKAPNTAYQYNSDTTMPAQAVSDVLAMNTPDILVILADSDIPPLLAALAAAAPAGWPRSTTQILLPVAGKTAQLIKDPVAEASVLTAIVGVEPADPKTPVSAGFLQDFNQYIMANPTAPLNTTFVPQSYDAMFLVAAAVAAAGSGARGTDVAAVLKLLSQSTGMHEDALFSEFRSLVNAMQQKSAVQFAGASGNIQFTASGDVANPIFGIWKVDPTKVATNPFTSLPLP
jgi:ABC-type branched-subunit amino acid transport system substrate-binding protein